VRAAHPLASVEVWAQDEHRVGLKPILRKVWTPVGRRPVVTVKPRYAWVWVYGFVHPQSGATEWLLLPRVDTPLLSAALAHFARAVGAGAAKRVILVLDRAGWHTSPELVVPEGLHLEFLPAHSPELQPAERLWPLADEGLANKLFATIRELEDALARRLVALADHTVRALTRFHWRPQGA
jgi:transposase